MNHTADELKPPHSRPSTPPLFNIASPDFKNFKSWVRSSPFRNETDHQKDNIQLSDMDFEAAYAMFTAHTPPQVPGTPPQIPTTNSPMASYTQEINQQIHELQNQKTGNSTKINITSPGIAQFLQNSPHLSPSDLESFPIFQNYDELLSANESNAIEQFLDSIMDEESSKNQTAKQFQKPQQLQPVQPMHALQPDPMSHHDQPLRQSLQEHAPVFPQIRENHQQIPSIHTDSAYFIDTPPSSHGSISITLNNDQSINIPKYSNTFPKELNISTEVPGSAAPTRSSSVGSSSESSTRQYKKRKLLTEDEKKYNHTSSEQRRRGIIKEAFDNLVGLLPELKGKKKPPKSVVLENAANEIERLINVNNELRKLLDG